MPKIMDARGNMVEVQMPTPIIVNGSFKVKPENDSKNPAYKSIHSTSVRFPANQG
jgi:hypothetical protein